MGNHTMIGPMKSPIPMMIPALKTSLIYADKIPYKLFFNSVMTAISQKVATNGAIIVCHRLIENFNIFA